MFFFFVRLGYQQASKHNLPNPVGKLSRVGHRSRKQNDADMFRQHNDDLLPHDTSLDVSVEQKRDLPLRH